MTESEYRCHPSVSRSDLWHMMVSPEKYRYIHDNPPIPTDALLFGQVFHKLVLEPDTFYDEFAVAPDVDMRTKAGKQEMEEFSLENPGKEIIPIGMFQQASEMRKSVMSVPQAVKLLRGEHEVPYFWKDEESGVECKCRADCISKIGNINVIVDLKSCADASTEKFSREALKYGYDFQSAFYSAGINECRNAEHIFVFIAVEKNPPYSVNILQADDLFVEHGKMIMRKLLAEYADCKQTGNWWGYMGREHQINTLTIPAWAVKDLEG